ncbi:hypothetical protein HPP92_020843 [Vanilla planifolia]|uniref:Uncharacterized protein n=1 Tax=Vanilla planifolia TaxID=51239 RepID=A0A835UHZ3_VANPL|nr:hypothetical protein HPP92_020843 [Vanilla planifolia]
MEAERRREAPSTPIEVCIADKANCKTGRFDAREEALAATGLAARRSWEEPSSQLMTSLQAKKRPAARSRTEAVGISSSCVMRFLERGVTECY